jgi:hypothetical protein
LATNNTPVTPKVFHIYFFERSFFGGAVRDRKKLHIGRWENIRVNLITFQKFKVLSLNRMRCNKTFITCDSCSSAKLPLVQLFLGNWRNKIAVIPHKLSFLILDR